MSKREASTQLTKAGDTSEDDGFSAGSQIRGAPRATAAQMAARRLAQPRRRAGTPVGARPAQHPTPGINQNAGGVNGTQQQQNAFSVPNGTNPNQPNQASQSQSFPPFGGTGNGSSNSQVAPSNSTTFDFTAGPTDDKNPFLKSRWQSLNYHGSIFNLTVPKEVWDARRQDPVSRREGELPPQFEAHAPFTWAGQEQKSSEAAADPAMRTTTDQNLTPAQSSTTESTDQNPTAAQGSTDGGFGAQQSTPNPAQTPSTPLGGFGAQQSTSNPPKTSSSLFGNFGAQQSSQTMQPPLKPLEGFGSFGTQQSTSNPPQTSSSPFGNFGTQQSDQTMQPPPKPSGGFGSFGTQQSTSKPPPPSSSPFGSFGTQQSDQTMQPPPKPLGSFGSFGTQQSTPNLPQTSSSSSQEDHPMTSDSSGPSQSGSKPFSSTWDSTPNSDAQNVQSNASNSLFASQSSRPLFGSFNQSDTQPPATPTQDAAKSGTGGNGFGSTLNSTPNSSAQNVQSNASSSLFASPSSRPFSFLNQANNQLPPTQQEKTATPGAGSGLFGRIAEPTPDSSAQNNQSIPIDPTLTAQSSRPFGFLAQSNAQVPSNQNQAVVTPAAGSGLFGRIEKPPISIGTQPPPASDAANVFKIPQNSNTPSSLFASSESTPKQDSYTPGTGSGLFGRVEKPSSATDIAQSPVSDSANAFKFPQTPNAPSNLLASSGNAQNKDANTPGTSSGLFGRIEKAPPSTPDTVNTSQNPKTLNASSNLFVSSGNAQKQDATIPATGSGLFGRIEKPPSPTPDPANASKSPQTSNPPISNFKALGRIGNSQATGKNLFGQTLSPQTSNKPSTTNSDSRIQQPSNAPSPFSASLGNTQPPKKQLFGQSLFPPAVNKSSTEDPNEAGKGARAGSKPTHDDTLQGCEDFTEEESTQLTTGIRLRDFDAYMHKCLRTNPPRSELVLLKKFYHETTTAIIRANGGPIKRPEVDLKRKNGDKHGERKRVRTQSSPQATQETFSSEKGSTSSDTSSLFKGILGSKGQEQGSQPPADNGATNAPQNAAKASEFKVPTFAAGTTPNFMAQFGKAAEKTAEEVKNKRKAEEYDSDEEDEAAWERKYEEEQRSKRQKHKKVIKANNTTIVNGKLEWINTPKEDSSIPAVSKEKSTGPARSIFDQPLKPIPINQNLFGHLAGSTYRANGSSASNDDKGRSKSQDDDPEADDEGDEDNDENNADQGEDGSDTDLADKRRTVEPKTPSLFDRISKDANGNPIREIPQSDKENVTADSPANAINTGESPAVQYTWKAGGPINFGSPSNAPTVDVTGPSPSKSPLTGLFGAPKNKVATNSPIKPATSPSITTPSKTATAALGFGFTPANRATNSLVAPSNTASAGTSRATSPGVTTGESANESNAENDDEPQDAQVDLVTTGLLGEEYEEAIFSVKSKAHVWDPKAKQWVVKGVGSLRVLKHRERPLARIVMRAIPSGRIVINTPLLKDFEYKKTSEKVIQVPIADEDANVATWMLKVGEAKDATALLKVLMENMPK